MANSKDKQSGKWLLKAFRVAKKLTNTEDGISSQATSSQKQSSGQQYLSALDLGKVLQNKAQQDPRELLRAHLPQVSHQVLGRHFQTVNRVTHFLSPELNHKVSDYFFDRLNELSNDLSSVDAVLDEVGIRDLEELTQDVERSQRIGKAFLEQNKWIASIQGAFSGATGVVGSAADIPLSLMIALKMIYQVGRAYGFDLEKEQDQDVVQYIFRQIDLGILAEKQTLLMVVKAFSNTLKTHDISQLQQLLGSGNDFELLKQWMSTEQGQIKWSWLNQLNSSQFLQGLSRLRPVFGAGVGAVYSRRLVEDVHLKAQEIFSMARQYLLEHQEQINELSPIMAYEAAKIALADLKLHHDFMLEASNSAVSAEVKSIDSLETLSGASTKEASNIVVENVMPVHEAISSSSVVDEALVKSTIDTKEIHALESESSQDVAPELADVDASVNAQAKEKISKIQMTKKLH